MSDETWYILIVEETGDRTNRRRELTKKVRVLGDITQAREEALDRARTYSPRHPWKVRSRTIYQTSQDFWLVETVGSTSEFHFTVQLASLVE